MALLSNLFANFFMVFLVLAFVAIVLLLEGLYLFWNTYKSPEAKKIERRLHSLAAGATGSDETPILKQRLLSAAPALQRLMFGIPRLRQLDQLLQQSGLKISVARLLFLALCLAIVSYGLALLLHFPAVIALALAVAAAAAPFLYVQRRRAERMLRLERQLPDALDLICRALRAGHAFGTGLQMVGEEMTEPIAGEFRITHEEVNFGVSLQQALLNMAARIPSTDLRYFVIAVLIQRDSGGNLTEVLSNLSVLIRERFKLLEKVRVLSSEGKLSAWILSILPFAVAGVINIVNPHFMQVLWVDDIGLKMVGMALLMMLLGIIWMRQIIRIHV
ncbi:MAG: type II secretion system F family protein [Rhodocyclaceae bacterium]|nr:type II secretion system F family protein [Rhodocyclaceae bacterium]